MVLAELGMSIDELADDFVQRIYTFGIFSPFAQLEILEEILLENPNITYKKLTARINAQLKDTKTCISCSEVTTSPCHAISTTDLTVIKDSLPHKGISRGSAHNPTKVSDKEKLVDSLISALEKQTRLGNRQKDDIRARFLKLRTETLALFTGLIITKTEQERPMDSDVYDDGREKLLAYLINFNPEFADWDKPNIAERLGLDEKDLALERGLDELLPLRDRNYIKYGTIPKYKQKIDIKDYIPWWKLVNWVDHYFPEAFKGLKENKLPLQYQLQGQLPVPCEKNIKWHEDNKGSARRLEIGIEDPEVTLDYLFKKAASIKEGNRLLWNPIGSKHWQLWVISAAAYFAVICVGLTIVAIGYFAFTFLK